MNRTDRSRERSLAEAIGRSGRRATAPKSSFVGLVIDGGSIPTAGRRYCLVHPVEVSGTESEGSAPVLTADASRTVVVAMVEGVPAVGDYLIVEPEGNRWVAEKQPVAGYYPGGCVVLGRDGFLLPDPDTGGSIAIPTTDLILEWYTYADRPFGADIAATVGPITTTLTYHPPTGGAPFGSWSTPTTGGDRLMFPVPVWGCASDPGSCCYYVLTLGCTGFLSLLNYRVNDATPETLAGCPESYVGPGNPANYSHPSSGSSAPFLLHYENRAYPSGDVLYGGRFAHGVLTPA